MLHKLLVVDDDPDLRKSVLLLFGSEYEFFEAGDGPEALRMIEAERPDVVLLDVSLPEMHGLEVLRAARSLAGRPAVVMLTAEEDLDLAREALDNGAAAYITKPFDASSLRREISRLMARPGPDADEDRPWRVA